MASDTKFDKMEEVEPCSKNFHPNINSSKPNKNSIFLDTKGSCFLCLKNTSLAKQDNLPEENDKEDNLTPVEFGTIYRYLNLNTKLVVQKFLEETADEKPPPNISAMLCVSCLSVTKKLSELIQQLERTKIMINHQLQLFQELIVTESEEKLDSKHDKTSTDNNSEETGIVEHLKLLTIDKCDVKITQSNNLQVRVKKLDSVSPAEVPDNLIQAPDTEVEQLAAVSSSEKPLPPEKEMTSGNSRGKLLEVNIEEEAQDKGAVQMKMAFASKLVMQLRATKAAEAAKVAAAEAKRADAIKLVKESPLHRFSRHHTQTTEPGEPIHCVYCDFIDLSVNKVLRHSVTNHVHEIFSDCKKPFLTQEDFNACCEIMLKQELKLALAHQKKNQAKNVCLKIKQMNRKQYLCLLCNDHCYTNDYSFKYHMVIKHFDLLSEKLSFHQEEFTKKKAEILSKYVSEPPPPGHIQVENKYPKVAIIGASATSACNPPPQEPDSGPVLNFSIQPITATLPSNIPAVSRIPMDIFASHFEILDPGNIFKCLYCGYINKTEATKVRRHIEIHHVHKIFQSVKLPNITEDDFSEYCKEFLNSEIITAQKTATARGGGSEDGSRKKSAFCLHCNQFFQKGSDFRYHFVLRHYKLMEKHLIHHQAEILKMSGIEVIIQEMPEETEESSNSKTNKKVNIFVTKPASPNPITTKSSESTFECLVSDGGCGKKFPIKRNLNRHITNSCPLRKRNTKKIWMICEQSEGGCGKSFPDAKCLQQHQRCRCRAWVNKVWMCLLETGGCGRTFLSQRTLKSHQINCRSGLQKRPLEILEKDPLTDTSSDEVSIKVENNRESQILLHYDHDLPSSNEQIDQGVVKVEKVIDNDNLEEMMVDPTDNLCAEENDNMFEATMDFKAVFDPVKSESEIILPD